MSYYYKIVKSDMTSYGGPKDYKYKMGDNIMDKDITPAGLFISDNIDEAIMYSKSKNDLLLVIDENNLNLFQNYSPSDLCYSDFKFNGYNYIKVIKIVKLWDIDGWNFVKNSRIEYGNKYYEADPYLLSICKFNLVALCYAYFSITEDIYIDDWSYVYDDKSEAYNNDKNSVCNNMLMCVAARNGSLDVLKILCYELETNNKNNIYYPDQYLPLKVAAKHNQFDVVKFLIEEMRMKPDVDDLYVLKVAYTNKNDQMIYYLEKMIQKKYDGEL